MFNARETITVDSVCRDLTELNKEWITINEFENSHPKYDKTDDTSFGEYLAHKLNEHEMIECLHVLSCCNCCEKHTCGSHELQYVELTLPQCMCQCRHYRRHLYRGIYQYANTGTPQQNSIYDYDDDEEEESQPGSVDSESDDEERICPIDQMGKYNKYVENLYRDDNMKLDNQIVTAEQIDDEGDEDILPHLLDAQYEESDEEEQKMQRDQIEKYDKYIANLYHEDNMKLINQIVTTEQIDNEGDAPYEESEDSDDSLPPLIDAPSEDSDEYPMRMMIM